MNLILKKLINRYPDLNDIENFIQNTFDILKDCFANDHTLFVCGNGGSAADSEHIVGELVKGFLLKRELTALQKSKFKDNEYSILTASLQQGFKAISLTSHPSLSTAIINDIHGDMIFAQQLFALGRSDDVLLGISTSGNAKNVGLAAETARAIGMKVVGLSGSSGGNLKELSDVCICVPFKETYIIQEYHLPIYHCLCAMLEDCFFN